MRECAFFSAAQWPVIVRGRENVLEDCAFSRWCEKQHSLASRARQGRRVLLPAAIRPVWGAASSLDSLTDLCFTLWHDNLLGKYRLKAPESSIKRHKHADSKTSTSPFEVPPFNNKNTFVPVATTRCRSVHHNACVLIFVSSKFWWCNLIVLTN